MSSKRKTNGVPQAKTNNNTVDTSKTRATDAEQNVKIEKVMKQHQELFESQKFISMQYDELIKELKKCVEANNNLKKELSAVSRKCIELNDVISLLKLKQNRHDQDKLNNNVIIRGIKENEDAGAALRKIAAISEVALLQGDVTSVRQQQYNNKCPVITAQFNCKEKKIQFVRAAKTKKISTQMYGYDGEPQPIYVDTQITRESFLLFKSAKELKKLGVRFVWLTIEGEILIREKPNDRIICIKNEKQIMEIQKSILLRNKTTEKLPQQPVVNPMDRANSNNKSKKRVAEKVTPKNVNVSNTSSQASNTHNATRNVNVTSQNSFTESDRANSSNKKQQKHKQSESPTKKNSQFKATANSDKISESSKVEYSCAASTSNCNTHNMNNVSNIKSDTKVNVESMSSNSTQSKKVSIREDLNDVHQQSFNDTIVTINDTLESNEASFYSDADDSVDKN